MAPKKNTDTPPVNNDAPPAANTQPEATAKQSFNWDALPEPVAMPNKPVSFNFKANVLSTVPEPIRLRAEACLAINAKRVAAKPQIDAKRARIDYHWDFQAVTDEAMAGAFHKLIYKYAKYRPADKPVPHADEDSPKGQVTARCGNPGHFRKDSRGDMVGCAADAEGAVYGLRYSVRPFEQRADAARVPGTE